MPRNLGVQGYLPRASQIRKNTDDFNLRRLGRSLGLTNAMIDSALRSTGRVHQTLGSFGGGSSTSRVRSGGGRSGVRDSSGLGFSSSAAARKFRNFRAPISRRNRLNRRSQEAFERIKQMERSGGRLTDSQRRGILNEAFGPEQGGLVFGGSGKPSDRTIPGGPGRGIEDVLPRGIERALRGGLISDKLEGPGLLGAQRDLGALSAGLSSSRTTRSSRTRRGTRSEQLENERIAKEARRQQSLDIRAAEAERKRLQGNARIRISADGMKLAREKFEHSAALKDLTRRDKDIVLRNIGELSDKDFTLDEIKGVLPLLKSGGSVIAAERAVEAQREEDRRTEESKLRIEQERSRNKEIRTAESREVRSSVLSLAEDVLFAPDVGASENDLKSLADQIQKEWISGDIQDEMATFGITLEQVILGKAREWAEKAKRRTL